MGFKRYHLGVVLLLALLVSASMALAWAALSHRFHLAIGFLLLDLTAIYLLFRLFTQTHRNILFFFKALENEDTSIRYTSSRKNRLLDELNQYLNVLNQNFKEIKMRQELREQYFNQILENLSSGLMVVAKTGHVNHINKEALHLFNLSNLTHIHVLH